MMKNGGGDIKINVDMLATELEKMISDNVPILPKRSPSCIFRVPNILSRHNPKAYEPSGFSIGPFHYNKPNLKATQKIKMRYLRELIISRFPNTNPKTKLRDLMEAISKVQKEAHECYEGSINVSMDEFVKILVLDGCFLIELFRKSSNKELRGKDDPIFGVGCMNTMLGYDLVLLENQIPWLVLECLFHNTINNLDANLPLTSLVLNFFGISKEVGDNYQNNLEYGHKHILHLFRNLFILPSTLAKQKRDLNCSTNDWQMMPSATSLHEAGIKFKKATSGTFSSILDIQFKNGVLEIPPIFIQDGTESLFRNLICLEQCLPHCEELISSYMALFDGLISNAKDMEILIKSEIIKEWTGTKNTTIFFNQIVSDTNMSHFYYLGLVLEMNKYCGRRWLRYRRVLMRDYFKHPWTLVLVLVFAIFLVLTFLQTLFTIIK
ncbi:UPF0481 protein At3g47200-like [Humulus lupulus]|uniref:UPF0481 protein At3g47200-like n=1 Tax=Humulus lupulus TaxID=3486 RepID=UPI002B409B1B|nr:UPF0481 protein At3g47200-like [Humulus lupulus]